MFLFIRFLVLSGGQIQSLILGSTLIMMGFLTWVTGIQSDTIAANRKLLEDIQKHVRMLDYDGMKMRETNIVGEASDSETKTGVKKQEE